jgi:protein SCO1
VNRRTLRIILLSMAAFVGGLFAARALFAPAAPPTLQRATWLPDGPRLPHLALIDQDDKAFDGSSLSGRWTIVFFGFTSCPDVCPTTLATLARLTRELQDLPADQQPRVLLISVDPERDRPQQLRGYVRAFDPGFRAATGTQQAVAGAAQAFGVGYARVSRPDGSYSVDHGSGLFIVGPHGSIVAASPAPHDSQTLAVDYRAIVEAYRKRR